jgi:4-amino-4-deoxychorismate lyase
MANNAVLSLVNGQFCDLVSASNRGLAYGDGVFETILVRACQPLWLDDHLARLASGAGQLNISCDISQIRRDCSLLLAGLNTSAAVLKVVLTRGAVARGYTPYAAESDRILSLSAYTQSYQSWDDGIALGLCQTQLSAQKRLAGIKHLNRLEQVLAAEELHRRGYHEGLMMQDGLIIEGSRSNVFLVLDGKLFTPSLSRCGVDGVMRQHVLARANQLGISINIKEFGVSLLQRADEVFVCNSVFGIWPVSKVECMHKQIGPVSRLFQREFHSYFYV